MEIKIQHDTYGEIVYSENFWSGKRKIFVNGAEASSVSKKIYIINGKQAVIKGTYLTGSSILIDNESIVLFPKPKWYETLIGLLPIIFLLTWGNIPSLCAIFPVIGGGLGGALGGIAYCISIVLMNKARTSINKILTGLGVFAGSVLIAYIIATAILSAPA